MDITLRVVDGWAILPASLKRADGTPRFTVGFPKAMAEDVSIRYLISHEMAEGYEMPTRNLLERTLRPGDLFLDVGAHWGLFSFQAVTHPAGDILAIAIEAESANAMILGRNVVGQGLTDRVQVVCCACAGRNELMPLVTNTSMGHSLNGAGLKGYINGPVKWVAAMRLDDILRRFPATAGRRVVLKIDAEGAEPEVLAGAAELLASGRVALIIWERGLAFDSDPERAAMFGMLAMLDRLGFRHLRPPDHCVDGELRPFAADQPYLGNVYSLGPAWA
jgi:FkbM family methyltransferase